MGFRIFTGILLVLLTGCSVGGRYGYDSRRAAIPASASDYRINLASRVDPFLQKEFSAYGGIPERLESRDDYVEYVVRCLHGYVVHDNNQWELIQVSFTLTGGSDRQVVVSADGWLASGFRCPLDTQFTKSMQPEYSAALANFTRNLRSDFSDYMAEDAGQ